MAALGIGLLLVAVTAVTVGAVWGHVWWLPVNISAHGAGLDHQLNLTLLATGALFVVAQLGLAYAVWKHRRRDDARKAGGASGNIPLELAWVIASAVLFVALSSAGYRVWAEMYLTPAPPGSLQIAVKGEQFAYSFRYPGPDGKFGPIHPGKMDDSAGNPWGLDRDHDTDSRDDIVTATLGVPVNRPVELLLTSRDVGHSFYVRELRLQQDMLPGTGIPIHFTATATGQFEIVCTQLCGLGHYRMRAFLKVMTESEFDQWLHQQAESQ